MKFRRTMMVTEWEHMRLRMKINDFIEQKRDIENVKVPHNTPSNSFVITFFASLPKKCNHT